MFLIFQLHVCIQLYLICLFSISLLHNCVRLVLRLFTRIVRLHFSSIMYGYTLRLISTRFIFLFSLCFCLALHVLFACSCSCCWCCFWRNIWCCCCCMVSPLKLLDVSFVHRSSGVSGGGTQGIFLNESHWEGSTWFCCNDVTLFIYILWD